MPHDKIAHQARSGRRLPALLALILAVALVLRLYGLSDRGVLLWDEGSYLLEGRFIATGVQAAAWKLAGTLPWVEAPQPEQLRSLVAGIASGIMGKPGHAGLVAVSMLLFGDTTYAPALVSVACSLALIWLVWRLGLVYHGPVLALAAAGLLAVSPYMLFYSRVGLAELDFALGGLILMALVWRHWRTDGLPSRWGLMWLGVAVGLVFLLNYRGYMLLALCVLWMAALLLVRRAPPGRAVADLALLGVGFVLPLLAMEGLHHLGAIVAATVHPEAGVRTYFQQLHWLATNHGSQPPTAANAGTYPYLFGLWEGPGLVLLLTGTAVAARRRRWEDLLVLSFFWLPLLQWSVRHDAYARLAVMNLPTYGLLAGLGLAAMWRVRRWRAMAVAMAGGFVLWAGWQGLPIVQARSEHETALTLTAQQAHGPLVDTNPGVSVVHDHLYGLHDIIRLPERPAEALTTLRQARDAGGGYLISDMQRFISGTQLMSLGRYRDSASHIIDRQCEPIWQALHMRGMFLHICFEHNWGLAQTLELYRTYREEAEMIRIYRLDEAIEALQQAGMGGEEGRHG